MPSEEWREASRLAAEAKSMRQVVSITWLHAPKRLHVKFASGDEVTWDDPDEARESLEARRPVGGVAPADEPLRVSLLPLDVGFDLRQHGTPVLLLGNKFKVEYIDADGKPETVAGDFEHVAGVLEGVGYVVARGDGGFDDAIE